MPIRFELLSEADPEPRPAEPEPGTIPYPPDELPFDPDNDDDEDGTPTRH